MVNRVTVRNSQSDTFPHGVVFLPEEKKAVVDSLVSLCSEFPWEHLVSFSSGATGGATAKRPRPTAVLAPSPVRKTPTPRPPITAPAPAPTRQPAPPISRPGCTAADSCLLVHGYLVNLAEGKSGFGVLRLAKERLEEGAAGAEQMGEPQLAASMRQISQSLPQVKTPEAAAALAPKLKALSDQTWDLGRRCGGHNLSPEALEKAQALARKVQKGELSMEEAVKQVKEPNSNKVLKPTKAD